YLLHKNNVSWGYYIFGGNEPDCESDAAMTCRPVKQGPATPGVWNPLPYFVDVRQQGDLNRIKSIRVFYSALRASRGTSPCLLAHVSWIVPNSKVSEHPPASVSAGEAYVTGL